MSHWPGFTLENFVTDTMRVVHGGDMGDDDIRRIYAGQSILTAEQFAVLVGFFEPHRAQVEERLGDYSEEENGSWRDYAGYAFDFIPDAVYEDARAFIAEIEPPTTPGIA